MVRKNKLNGSYSEHKSGRKKTRSTNNINKTILSAILLTITNGPSNILYLLTLLHIRMEKAVKQQSKMAIRNENDEKKKPHASNYRKSERTMERELS